MRIKTNRIQGNATFLSVCDPFQLLGEVRRGIRTELVFELARTAELAPEAIFAVAGVSERTVQRRRDGLLTPGQSDRVARIARIVTLTVEIIGDRARAARWLQRPNRSLRGVQPLELLDTDAGSWVVERVLGQLREGVFS
ncbi:MAG: type II RES/Xre toxin-antitoxin system antitoxin [Vulcanimicrobiaceae bacterium]